MVTWERALADAQTKQADPLAGLIDIPLPQEVSLWPQTWPLRIAIVLIAVLAVLAIWRFVHRYRANRYRREALSELDRMRQMRPTRRRIGWRPNSPCWCGVRHWELFRARRLPL